MKRRKLTREKADAIDRKMAMHEPCSIHVGRRCVAQGRSFGIVTNLETW